MIIIEEFPVLFILKLRLTFRERPGPSIFLHKEDFCSHSTWKPILTLTFLSVDLCIMPTKLGKQTWPRNHAHKLAEKCVAKYITAKSCKAAGGIWKKFIINYVEKTAGILSTCADQGDMKLARGVPYEPHKLSQGADQKKQFVLLEKVPDVIYAPSTVVNHNGMNLEGKFSSYKWKVPCFPTITSQRCILRIR